jgi:hypothetical protein
MIVGDIKRRIVDETVFKKLGFQDEEIETVADSELSLYKDGPDITEYTFYPTGALMQDSKAKTPLAGLYYIISGEKQPVLTKEILDANFVGLKIKKVTAAELDKYMTGASVSLPDGWLVKSKKVNTVYVISHGKRLPIFSGVIFVRMNYNKKNIKVVSDETLAAHEIGQTITGDW